MDLFPKTHPAASKTFIEKPFPTPPVHTAMPPSAPTRVCWLLILSMKHGRPGAGWPAPRCGDEGQGQLPKSAGLALLGLPVPRLLCNGLRYRPPFPACPRRPAPRELGSKRGPLCLSCVSTLRRASLAPTLQKSTRRTAPAGERSRGEKFRVSGGTHASFLRGGAGSQEGSFCLSQGRSHSKGWKERKQRCGEEGQPQNRDPHVTPSDGPDAEARTASEERPPEKQA